MHSVPRGSRSGQGGQVQRNGQNNNTGSVRISYLTNPGVEILLPN